MAGLFFMIFGTLWCAGLIGIAFLEYIFDFIRDKNDVFYMAYLIWGCVTILSYAVLHVN